jgi:2-C-methyl-D-erythritol 4-phosphate cytidylyltransferase/2-C-methyl-D-erythritol 2,4-cyclodiphosphate synthase
MTRSPVQQQKAGRQPSGRREWCVVSDPGASLRVVAIIAAGGQGRRLGDATPKQLLVLGGRTILERSIAAFVSHPRVSNIVVALPPDVLDPLPSFLAGLGPRVRFVPGGARRQDSVARAFEAIDPPPDVIVIHDAARPFVDSATIDRAIDGAIESGAAIAALPSGDTVKLAQAEEGGPRVAATIPRDRVWLAQTPQAFTREVLTAALAFGAQGGGGTDEAALAEQAGHVVRLVAGDPRNFKITTPADLEFARAALANEDDGERRPGGMGMRIGLGYDSHRLVQGRPLVLGGVTIPHGTGLAGHSDADALCHAITDAVLGAAAAGDIGRHFPDTDPRWKDADSLALLRQAVAIAAQAGYAVVNVDAVVIADAPRLAPYADAIRARLAEALGVGAAAVSVKGKTNEGMGETGRGEGIAVHAVAFLTGR